MNFSKKSWHFWVYKHVYQRYTVPKNLCPYFWKFVGALFVFLLTPFYLLYGIYKLIDERGWPHFYDDFGISIAFNAGSFFAVCMIWMFWRHQPVDKDHSDWVIVIGLVGWFILLTCAGFLIRERIKDRRAMLRLIASQERYRLTGSWDEPIKPRRVRKPWIFIEFIKATYKKHCPPIEWD